MSSNSSRRIPDVLPSRKGWVDLEYLLLAILLVCAAAAYFAFTNHIVRWNDPAGYVYAGQSIAESGRPGYTNENNASIGPYFTFRGFLVQRQAGEPTTYWSYAVGFPLLLALAFRLPIPEAYLYVVPLLGVLSLVFLFGLGRMLFGRWVGLLAAGILAFCPDFWALSTENWSDVPAVAFTLAGMALAIQGTRKNHLLLGFLGGALLGFAVLIRYPSVLALAPLGVYLWLVTRGKRKPLRAFAGILAGLVLLGSFVLLYQTVLFGGPFSTGYSADYGWVPWWPLFSWDNFIGRSPAGSGGLPIVVSSLWANVHVGLILALAGVLMMPRAEAVLIGGNILLFSLFQAAFLWPATDARFVLFALALVCLAAAYAAVRLLERLLRRESPWLAAAVVALIVLWPLPRLAESMSEFEARNVHSEVIVERVRAMTSGTEDDAVFLSQRYHDMIILYGGRAALYYALLAEPDLATQTYPLDRYEARLVDVIERLLEQGTPVYVVREPDTIRYRQGPIDPYPILDTHFHLEQISADPPVYKVDHL